MPREITRQTHMPTFMGKMPAVDAYGIIDNMAFKVNVVAKTADCTILASESGTFFTNLGCSGTIEFTLPSPADGLNYHFYSVAAGTMLIAGGTGTTIADDDVAANSIQFATSNEIIGNGVFVFSDGTKWMTMPMIEETVTVTVAT